MGTLKDIILSNAELVHGPHRTYDILYASAHSKDGSPARHRKTEINVYLVAWTDAGVTILMDSGATYEGVQSALSRLYYGLANQVFRQMLPVTVGYTISVEEIMARQQFG